MLYYFKKGKNTTETQKKICLQYMKKVLGLKTPVTGLPLVVAFGGDGVPVPLSRPLQSLLVVAPGQD